MGYFEVKTLAPTIESITSQIMVPCLDCETMISVVVDGLTSEKHNFEIIEKNNTRNVQILHAIYSSKPIRATTIPELATCSKTQRPHRVNIS